MQFDWRNDEWEPFSECSNKEKKFWIKLGHAEKCWIFWPTTISLISVPTLKQNAPILAIGSVGCTVLNLARICFHENYEKKNQIKNEKSDLQILVSNAIPFHEKKLP